METTSIKQKNQLNYYMQVTEYRKCTFMKGYYLYYNSIKIIKCLSICSLSAVSGYTWATGALQNCWVVVVNSFLQFHPHFLASIDVCLQ